MDEIDLGGEAGEERCFFAGGVTTTDDANWDVPVKGTIAGRAGGEAVADEFFFAGESEPFRAGSGSHDEGLGFHPFSVDPKADDFSVVLELLSGCELEARAEPGGLGLDIHDEVGALDAFGETGKVFDQRGGGELSTGFMAFEDEGGEVCTGGVNCGGESGAARADDDEFFHDGWNGIGDWRDGKWAVRRCVRLGCEEGEDAASSCRP